MMDNIKIDRINALAHKAEKCRSYRRRKGGTGRSFGREYLDAVRRKSPCAV